MKEKKRGKKKSPKDWTNESSKEKTK